MKWITARHLDQWADRTEARNSLSEIVSRLVRASAANASSSRFPSGDSAQIPGYDGRLTAVPAAGFERFLPEGDSVWEFGTAADYREKANKDFKTRANKPGTSVAPGETTFVFVTPRTWPDAADWISDKKKQGPWKDVRVVDGVALEDWLDECRAVASAVAREIVGTLPATGSYTPEEFWQEYAAQFRYGLTAEVVLAGRATQAQELSKILLGVGQISRWQGDSLSEVLAFVVATIRKADAELRKFFEARVLIVETREAARQLAGMKNLIFFVRDAAVEMAGMLAATSPVIVPLGRDSLRDADAIRLKRPSTFEMAEALKSMGMDEQECQRLARECDRSVTILARRIPCATANLPTWHGNRALIPALLAGAWDSASEYDRQVVATLAGSADYASYEASLRSFLIIEDAPLEREGSIWAVRAPVDVFVHLAPLLGTEHLNVLLAIATQVFGELNPALDLRPEDRPFAQLRGATPRYSSWLRDGLATSLLILAALGEKAGVQLAGTTPQRFVNELVTHIPGLRDDHRVIASLSRELPLLMEAAPDPLLAALEHLLEGTSERIKPIFQDSSETSWFGSSSPHTGLLWALELAAWDPAYIARAASVLTMLSRVDPGGSLLNRPANSLAHVLLPWHPETNATPQQRLAVLDQILKQDDEVGWKLLKRLLPRRPDFGSMSQRPRFREAGASGREVLTRGMVLETYREIIKRAVTCAGRFARRWADILDLLHAFPQPEQEAVIYGLERAVAEMPTQEREVLWKHLSEVIRHHEAHQGAEWSLPEDEIRRLRGLTEQLAPEDPVEKSLWLFTERFPEIEFTSADDWFKEVEARRKSAAEIVWRERGMQGILDLAASAEAPRYVGFAFGHLAESIEVAHETIVAALQQGDSMGEFASWVSAVERERFGDQWSKLVGDKYRTGELTPSQVVTLILAWPHRCSTWQFAESIGDQVSTAFWQSKQAWAMEAGPEDVEYAIRKYLSVDRAELVVDALANKVKNIPTDLILNILDQFETRIAAAPAILNNQSIAFDLQQFFAELQTRSDIPLTEVASREYRYLPLLRDVAGIDRGHPLAIDRYMSESPQFFVQVLCDVFRPTSQRQRESPPVSPEQQTRARWGWKLLDGFTKIPGHDGDRIDVDKLKPWVAEVRRLAAEADRLPIADQRIGAVLAHAPADPEDQIWPHRAVREGLEEWNSKEIERGMHIERLNMRGVTTRAYREGGEQERGLAADARGEALRLAVWPRTQALILGIAISWDEAAKREDLEARQDELREL